MELAAGVPISCHVVISLITRECVLSTGVDLGCARVARSKVQTVHSVFEPLELAQLVVTTQRVARSRTRGSTECRVSCVTKYETGE